MTSHESGGRPATAGVVTFPSAHHAFQAEKACQEAEIPVLLIPIPREITADCGTALLFDTGEEEQIKERLTEMGVKVAGWHRIALNQRTARLWERVAHQAER